MKNISELKDIHNGNDLYVVASGASAGYIEPSFFDNKIAIGVNQVWHRFLNLDYVVCKDGKAIKAAVDASKVFGFEVITSRYQYGMVNHGKNKANGCYVFDHKQNELTELDLTVLGTDLIVVSYSTITSAIHIAAYMGASNIILVGHDCGTLDGKVHMPGYTSPPQGDEAYLKFIQEIEPQTLLLRERLAEVYNVNIYSLNPFINFGLEGHEYKK